MQFWRANCQIKVVEPVQKPEAEERWERSRRHHHFLTGSLVVLAMVIAGLAWYAYPMLKRQDASMGQLRQEIRDRINQVQAKATDTSSEQDSIRGDAAKLGRDLRARIDALGRR